MFALKEEVNYTVLKEVHVVKGLEHHSAAVLALSYHSETDTLVVTYADNRYGFPPPKSTKQVCQCSILAKLLLACPFGNSTCRWKSTGVAATCLG